MVMTCDVETWNGKNEWMHGFKGVTIRHTHSYIATRVTLSISSQTTISTISKKQETTMLDYLLKKRLQLFLLQYLLVLNRIQPANSTIKIVPRLKINPFPDSHQRCIQHIIVDSFIVCLHHMIHKLCDFPRYLGLKQYIQLCLRSAAQRTFDVLSELQR